MLRGPPSAVRRPSSVVRRPSSVVRRPSSAVRPPFIYTLAGRASLANAKRNSRAIFGGNATFVLIFSFIDGNCFSNFND
jgi:hypothetical protein